jgi:hypothetical protein
MTQLTATMGGPTGATEMNHAHIEDNGIVELYVTGRLPPDQQREFEIHMLSCPRCTDAIEEAGLLRQGLRLTDGLVEPRRDTARPAGVLERWFAGRPALAAAAVLAIGVLPATVVWLNLRGVSSPGTMSAVRGDATLIALAPVRSSEERPAYRVRLGETPFPLVVMLEAEPSECDRYAATLLGPTDATLWHGSGLELDAYDTVPIVIDSALLAPGDYRFELSTDSSCRTPNRIVARYGVRFVP